MHKARSGSVRTKSFYALSSGIQVCDSPSTLIYTPSRKLHWASVPEFLLGFVMQAWWIKSLAMWPHSIFSLPFLPRGQAAPVSTPLVMWLIFLVPVSILKLSRCHSSYLISITKTLLSLRKFQGFKSYIPGTGQKPNVLFIMSQVFFQDLENAYLLLRNH